MKGGGAYDALYWVRTLRLLQPQKKSPVINLTGLDALNDSGFTSAAESLAAPVF